MKTVHRAVLVGAILAFGLAVAPHAVAVEASMKEAAARVRVSMESGLSPEAQARLDGGLAQVAGLWRVEDGDAAAFEAFVRQHFAVDSLARDTLFARCERLLEQLDGHMTEIGRELRLQTDLDLGPLLPADALFAGYDPSAHLNDDFFANKLAFVVLLNFPLTTLDERQRLGEGWTRRQWAEARLAQRFSKRIPSDVQLEVARVAAQADLYISQYNIWLHHLVDAAGRRPFDRPGLKLISHWGLRDELKAQYAAGPAGLARQRLLQRVMERIVTQTIPAVVIDNPAVDWEPVANTVRPAGVSDAPNVGPLAAAPTNAPEPDTRYALLLETYRAVRRIDPYSPTAPTHIARVFDEGREIPEPRVQALFESALSSPLLGHVARLIERRLGRRLEPFDIWYNGFLPRGSADQATLDALTRKRYPNAAAFEADLPSILGRLGFAPERARVIASAIAVDPARGSGHAMGAAMRQARARLRTRVGADGMDYKGFNIALHELGHNVEQTISLRDVDHWLLNGVPNTAFTEAFAFVFQVHDLELLGVATPDAQARAFKALNDYWATCEIAAVAFVDMGVWHWMYDHPEATPADLRAATLSIARDIWNRYYAPVLGTRDVELLAIYSHMIDNFLYLPDYPIGHLIAFQVEGAMERAGGVGPELERMARQGRITPDLWMKGATGTTVGADALLAATERALVEVGR